MYTCVWMNHHWSTLHCAHYSYLTFHPTNYTLTDAFLLAAKDSEIELPLKNTFWLQFWSQFVFGSASHSPMYCVLGVCGSWVSDSWQGPHRRWWWGVSRSSEGRCVWIYCGTWYCDPNHVVVAPVTLLVPVLRRCWRQFTPPLPSSLSCSTSTSIIKARSSHYQSNFLSSLCYGETYM